MFRIYLDAKGEIGDGYPTYEDMVYAIMRFPCVFIKPNGVVTDTWNHVIGFWEEC